MCFQIDCASPSNAKSPKFHLTSDQSTVHSKNRVTMVVEDMDQIDSDLESSLAGEALLHLLFNTRVEHPKSSQLNQSAQTTIS